MSRTRTAEKHEEILEAAAGAFGARPFHDVAVDDIAAAAGVGKGTIYRYFLSKEELYLAAAHSGMRQLLDRIEAELPGPSLEEELRRIAAALAAFLWDRRDFPALMARAEEHLKAPQGLIREERQRIVEAVARVLARGLDGGSLPAAEAQLLAELFLGLVRTACLRRRTGHDREELAGRVVALFLHGARGRVA